MWNLDNPKEYCQGLQWIGEMTKFLLNFEANVNECDFGMMSFLLKNHDGKYKDWTNPDWHDCAWRRYVMDLPLYEYEVLQQYQVTGDYMEFKCNYYD